MPRDTGDRAQPSDRIEDDNAMAQKVIVELVDDLDGTTGKDVATVTFALDGADYAIDLNDSNADRLRDTLSTYVAAGRRTGGRVQRAQSGKPAERATAHREQTQAIRTWARENGFDVSDRGRIPANVKDAYELAQTKRGSRVAGKGRRNKASAR